MQFIAASIEQSELYPYLEQELSNKTLTIENWEQKEPEETKADYTTPPGDWTLIDVDSQLRLDGKLEGRELSTWQEFLAAPVDSHWYYTKEGFQGANVGTPVSLLLMLAVLSVEVGTCLFFRCCFTEVFD